MLYACDFVKANKQLVYLTDKMIQVNCNRFQMFVTAVESLAQSTALY